MDHACPIDQIDAGIQQCAFDSGEVVCNRLTFAGFKTANCRQADLGGRSEVSSWDHSISARATQLTLDDLAAFGAESEDVEENDETEAEPDEDAHDHEADIWFEDVS